MSVLYIKLWQDFLPLYGNISSQIGFWNIKKDKIGNSIYMPDGQVGRICVTNIVLRRNVHGGWSMCLATWRMGKLETDTFFKHFHECLLIKKKSSHWAVAFARFQAMGSWMFLSITDLLCPFSFWFISWSLQQGSMTLSLLIQWVAFRDGRQIIKIICFPGHRTLQKCFCISTCISIYLNLRHLKHGMLMGFYKIC